MKDHLGNTRATYAPAVPGLAQTAEYQHYYPFGMQLEALGYSSGADLPNNYLYNGKELQLEYGLEWYDYGARFYDAQIGRWHCSDPLAEQSRKWSPYNYCKNNPLRFIDPDGRADFSFDDILDNIDNYSLDKDGNIKLEQKTDDKTDHLYVKKDDGTLDKSKTIEVEKGILDMGLTQKSESGKTVQTTYQFDGDQTGKDLFKFVAQNTNVEWGLYQFGLNGGDQGKNLLVTTHSLDEITSSGEMSSYITFSLKQNIRLHDHNHPSGSHSASGGDAVNWKGIWAFDPKAICRIYTAQDNTYTRYYPKKQK